MNLRRFIGRIVGSYYIAFGIFIIYILSMAIGKTVFYGTGEFLPAFHANSSGYSFYAGDLSLLIQLALLISAGVMLVWKLRRWAAVVGIIGILVPSLVSLILELFVWASGGPPITELIRIELLAIGWGLFAGLPALGVVFAWRDLF